MLVVNLRTSRYDFYIGRSKHGKLHYGNPYHIGPNGTREEVIDRYELWLRGCIDLHLEQERRQWIMSTLHLLDGKRLGCYCAPQACHGDILIKLRLEQLATEQQASQEFTEII